MWAALRSDLTEFVNNVAEESSSALNAIDENIGIREIASNAATQSAKQDSMLMGADGDIVMNAQEDQEEQEVDEVEEEVNRLRELEETYLLPLVSLEFETKWSSKKMLKEEEVKEGGDEDDQEDQRKGEDNEVTEEEAEDKADETLDNEKEEKDEKEVEVSEQDDEVDIYLSQYDSTEINQIKEHLQSFQIESYTDEISQLLRTHPSLQTHFETLVPTEVSYHQFWMRYYYKCNPERIQQRWIKEEQEEEQRRLARAQVIRGGLSSVKNLLGGVGTVVRDAVSNTVAPTAKTVKNGGGSFLNGGSRPPFVLNTAVSDDESEEEELGWDSEDDYETDDDEEEEEQPDEEEESDYEEEVTEDEIVFSTSPTNQSQMDEERNQLQETIKLQKQEIHNLNETLKKHADLSKLESLEMSLFEKDAEIAALKASIQDQDPSSSSTTNDNASEKVSLLQQELSQTQQSMKTMEHNMKSILQENQSIKDQNQSLLNEIQKFKELVSQLKTTNETLVQQVQVANTTSSNTNTTTTTTTSVEFPKELQQQQQQQQMTQPEIDSLPSSLSSSCVKVAPVPSNNNDDDDDPLDQTTLEDKVDETVATNIHTNSVAASTTEAALVQGNVHKSDDEEDDWGDSWGEDDDL